MSRLASRAWRIRASPTDGAPPLGSIASDKGLTSAALVIIYAVLLHNLTGDIDMPRTIVLAYSGGLDTSIIVPWLREHYDARVICVAANIGQGDAELAGVREKALASGAEECFIEDLRHEFLTDYIYPTLR